ncbi:MAG: OmpA family protein [Polyangiaceae bacterium]
MPPTEAHGQAYPATPGQPGATRQEWGQPGAPGEQWNQPGAPGGAQGTWGSRNGEAQPGAQQPSAPPEEPVDTQLYLIGIDIDTKLATLCKIPSTNVFFEYDSAHVQSDSRDRLQHIATCVTTGPGRGKDILLIGHTDPRGSDAYNKHLGMSRAEAVAQKLREMGVKSTRIELESMGEERAAREPKAWPLERRVTIQLR